jgi:hypothetical protein
MSKFSVKEKFGQLVGFVGSVFGGAKAKLQQTVNKKPVTTTAEKTLQTTTTEATPPSELADGLVTIISVNEAETKTEGLSQETVSQSSVLEMVELAPTPPSVSEEEQEQVIPPIAAETETLVEVTQIEVIVSESSIEAETETLVEITQTEIVISETPTEAETLVEITQTEMVISETPTEAETETVVEITQTEVVVGVEETSEIASLPEVISPNSVTSESLATEAAEKPDMTVEEVKPVEEAVPEQIPLNKPVEE